MGRKDLYEFIPFHTIDKDDEHAPGPRSNHAITYLAPSNSYVIFGGSNDKIYYDEFHLLEPCQTGASNSVSYSLSSLKEEQKTTETESEENGFGFQWKVLENVIPSNHSFESAHSLSSITSDSLPHAGTGRDYHSMHYIPMRSEIEEARGYRVLILGNILFQSDSQEHRVFDMNEFRIEEALIVQHSLQAHWGQVQIASEWKPAPRQGHQSAVREFGYNGEPKLFLFY